MIEHSDSKKPSWIVGIGASAGGLDPLQSFIAALPQEFDFALVFIQYLSAKHKSLLSELLRAKKDLVVKTADRGEQALQLLQEGPELPAAMLIDIKMCGMSGIEMVRHIRADKLLKHIPVVILTNSTP